MSEQVHCTNRFLARLSDCDQKALFPRLGIVDLTQGATLHDVGQRFKAAYFPHDGIISLVVGLSTGDMVEAGTVGRDGVAGAEAGFKGTQPVNRAVVQIGGRASVVSADDLCALVDRSPGLRDRISLYQHFLLAQAQQCAACNATHPVERRLARWLLRCRDVADRDDINLTQDFIAEMLGVRRTSVSAVANSLSQAGLIECRRGCLRLLDVDGLRASACECYAAMNELSEAMLGFHPRP